MVNLCIALLAAGLICLVVEMFIPGFGVFGIVGLILTAVSAVFAVLYIPYGWIFVLLEVVLLSAIMYFMFKFMKKRQLHGHLIMKDTLNDDSPQIRDLQGFVGKEGTVRTVLRPFGEVDFNGVVMEATSSGPYLEKGVRVKVREIQENKLVVNTVQ
jgi:membrane-bound serine protease (ClpP class)